VHMHMHMHHVNMDMSMHMHMLMHMHTHAHAHACMCMLLRACRCAHLLPERERVSLCCRASEKVRAQGGSILPLPEIPRLCSEALGSELRRACEHDRDLPRPFGS
jgi:hypothetical protein